MFSQAYKKFKPEAEPSEAVLGKLRDYNIDLVPKYIMASGVLVKVQTGCGLWLYCISGLGP